MSKNGLKGLTYEERYGPERAREIKKKMSEAHIGIFPSNETRKRLSIAGKGRPSPKKGKTWKEMYGEERAEKMRKIYGHAVLYENGYPCENYRRAYQSEYWMVYAPNYLGTNKNGYVWEHTLIAEQVLGRLLKRQGRKRDEVVHHINGNKLDNRNCNLLICSNNYHSWLHHKMSALYMQEHFK